MLVGMLVDDAFMLESLLQLERAARAAQLELDRLAATRRGATHLAERWSGGHRLRFDARFAELDAAGRRLGASLGAVALLARRAAEVSQP